MATMKWRDLIRLLEEDGWVHVRTTGSHRTYHHPTKGTAILSPHRLNSDVPVGTFKAILKQAGIAK